jgi:hypothetical protein
MHRLSVLCGLLFLACCGSDIRLDIAETSLEPSSPVRIAVAQVQIVNDSPIKEKALQAPQAALLAEPIQSEFDAALACLLGRLVLPAEVGTDRAVVRIENASITSTYHPAKDIAIVGLIALASGVTEEYTAVIEGAIEIENNQDRVIKVVRFSVFGSATDKSGTDEEVSRGASAAAIAALQELQRDIPAKIERYLHEYALK